MVGRWLNRLVLVGLALVVSGSAGVCRPEVVSISCRRELLCEIDPASRHAIHLSDSLIVEASDSVLIGDSVLVRGTDYRFDYREGILYLVDAPPVPCLARIRYSVLPLALRRDYRLRNITETRGLSQPVIATRERPRQQDRSYDIRASGSKTVRLEAGTLNDLRVNQSLNLSIGGKIGENVEIRGVLSDKDMSIAQRTSTSEVKDLDRIFLEVRSPSAYARVGDLEIDRSAGELLAFRRNVTGFLANGSSGSKTLIASGATARSRYESANMQGAEGIAGPYVIIRSDGERSVIVRGSERVYLDGRLLKRGNSADYTIDYDRAEVYFNPKHLIRDGARIRIDYECVDHDSSRQFYFGSSGMALGDRADIAVTFARETKSKPEPDGETGTFENLSAGPGTDGWSDGGRFVGAGRGTYMRVETDTLYYYEYAGEGAGDYDVRFTRVGDEEGTYSYVYSRDWDTDVYVYTGSGAYVDRVRALPSPEAHVVHLSTSADVTDWFTLQSEVAQSKGNTGKDAGERDARQDRAYAIAMKVAGGVPEIGGRRAGELDLKITRKSVGKSYIGFDRVRTPDFLEKWAVDPADGFEVSNEMNLGYRLNDIVATTFELGSLETGAGLSRRHLLGLDVGSERFGLSAHSETGRMRSGSVDKGIERNSIGVRIPLLSADLGAGREFESRSRLTDSTCVRRERYYGEIKLGGAARMVSLEVSGGNEDREAGASWSAYSSTREARVNIEASRGRRFSLKGSAAQRRVDYAPATSLADQRISTGDFHLDLRDMLHLSSISLDYRLANTLTSMYEVELVRVDAGGDFDSLGNYVPGAGDHALSRREAGREPVTRVKADFAVEIGRKGKVLLDKSLSSRTALEVEGESSTTDVTHLALLHPGYLLDDSRMLFSRLNLSEEIVFKRSSALTVSIKARTSRLIDNRCLGRSERNSTDEVLTRLQSTGFKGTTVGLEGRYTGSDSWIHMESGATRPKRRSWTARLNLQKRITSDFRGRMGVELLDEVRHDPASHLTQASAGPAITTFIGGLRCDAGCSMKRILRSDSSATVLAPRRNSFDWNSRLNLRQGRYTSLSLEYTGRRTEGFDTFHNLRASLSATF